LAAKMTTVRSETVEWAPREAFETVLRWAVIPTFDLVLSYGDAGVIVVRRRIAPYKGVWALPGLRMHKPESIEDTLHRIALNELGLEIDPSKRTFLGQYVGRFRTEQGRQDLSTGYHVPVDAAQEIHPNSAHFTSHAIVKSVPQRVGAMYRFYLERYFETLEHLANPLKNSH
jgi:ADP-ribose pyrophosphatase YjhB (NUDIX family)